MKIREIKEIGKRGILFTFEFGDSVYLINLDNKLILCDTNEGKESMEYVKKYIEEHGLSSKEMIIFNSHSDWDHIWGNYVFQNNNIIASSECRKRMIERAEFDLEWMSLHHDGSIKIKLPNITFTDKLSFEDDEIDFIYAPGHTICSSICLDRREKIVYVGDLLEEPIPLFLYLDLNRFIETLEMIKNLDVNTIITTHSNIVSKELIDLNINYIKDVIDGKYLTFSHEYAPIIHANNIKRLLLFKYEDMIRNKLKDQFNFRNFMIDLWNFICSKQDLETKRLWDMREISYQDLENYIKEYYGKFINN